MSVQRTKQRQSHTRAATCRHRRTIGWILLAALVSSSGSAEGQGTQLSVAEQLVEQGRHYLEGRQYELAEQALQQALQTVDSVDAVSHARNRAVRMQCLRLLSHDCYPQMGRSAIRKALEAGQRYQQLLSSRLPPIPIQIEIRGPCENGLHLAELHLALGEDQAAEDLLRQLTAPTFDPMLELDLWLIRAKVARRLAAAESDLERRQRWKAAVTSRWTRIEDLTTTVLRQIAQDPPRLRKLAAHYRPNIAGPRELDLASASLRETLLAQAANGGPNAVLILARITAHEDHLPRAQRLTEALLEHSQDSLTRNPVFIGQLHSQLGALEATLGQFETAQDHYEQALDTIPRDLLSELKPLEATRARALRARTYDELGQLALAQGEYATADSHYQRALGAWYELSAQQDWEAAAVRGITRSLLHRLSLKKTQGFDHSDLLQEYETVQDFMERNLADGHPDLTELYCLLADAYLARPTEAHVDRARDCCRKATQIARSCGDPLGERQARVTAACILLEQGRWQQFHGDVAKAHDSWTKASNIWEDLITEQDRNGNALEIARIHRCLGDVHYLKQQFATAEREYRKAIDSFQETGALPIARFNAQIGLARVLEKQDRLAEATDCLRAALQTVDVAAATLPGSRRRQLAFYERFGEAYDLLATCLLDQNRPEEMLFFAECLRNRQLQDELRCLDGKTNPVDSLPREKQIEFAQYRQDLQELYPATKDERRFTPTSLRRRIAQDEKQIIRLWHQALAETPSFATLLPPLQHATEGHRTVQYSASPEDFVLYYYLGNQESYLIVIAGQAKPRFYPLTITPEQSRILFRQPVQKTVGLTRSIAERLAQAYVERIRKPRQESLPRATPDQPPVLRAAPSGGVSEEPVRGRLGNVVGLSELKERAQQGNGRPRAKYVPRTFGPEQAYALSDLLLPEAVVSQIRRQPSRYQHTIIVVDPHLQTLPFAALPLRPPSSESPSPKAPVEYVLNLFPPICYAPSLQVVDLLRARSRDRVPGNRVVAIGAVSPDLVHAREECELVAEHFAEEIVTPLLIGPRATKGLLMRYARTCRLLYFSDHAEVHLPADNITSGLTLFPRPLHGRHSDAALGARWPDDDRGELAFPEIFRLNLQGCEMVMLFACSTRRGAPTQLDSGQSLARAFLVAGAARVIATFWDLPDRVPEPILRRLLAKIERRANAGDERYAGKPFDERALLVGSLRSRRPSRRAVPLGPSVGRASRNGRHDHQGHRRNPEAMDGSDSGTMTCRAVGDHGGAVFVESQRLPNDDRVEGNQEFSVASDPWGSETESLRDEALLAAYRHGDEAAAQALFERYYARLVGLARKQMGDLLDQLEDSTDVAQSVFRSVFLRGRAHQIELGPQDSLWPLLVTITVNKIRNHVKFHQRQRRDRRRQTALDTDRDPLEIGPTPEDALRLQETIEELRGSFSTRRREIIDGLLKGLSVTEIAEQTGMAERTVYKTRQAVREILERMAME